MCRFLGRLSGERVDGFVRQASEKPAQGNPMHLKSYQIDGKLLRTGAANFSASGLKRQDDDLVVIESAEAAAAFKPAFDARFSFARRTSVWTNICGVSTRAMSRKPERAARARKTSRKKSRRFVHLILLSSGPKVPKSGPFKNEGIHEVSPCSFRTVTIPMNFPFSVQECALVHPLLDTAEGMLDDLATVCGAARPKRTGKACRMGRKFPHSR